RNDRKPPPCFVPPAGAADPEPVDALDDAVLAGAACALAAADRAELAGVPPACFALCSEIASISSGDSTSYGGRPSSRSRPRTSSIRSGSKPASMIDEQNAANFGSDQPSSGESSV